VEMYSQHAKHAGIRGSGDKPPQENFKLDAKILQFLGAFPHIALL